MESSPAHKTLSKALKQRRGIPTLSTCNSLVVHFTDGVTFDGYLKVQSDGFYQFVLESDDGSILQIDDEVVVDNDGNHASRIVTGHIPLRRGFHKLKLNYYQSEGGASLRISWAAAGGELKSLDGSALYH